MKFDNIKSQFPIFKQKIKGKPLIYLDSANSSQKPKTVFQKHLYYLLVQIILKMRLIVI